MSGRSHTLTPLRTALGTTLGSAWWGVRRARRVAFYSLVRGLAALVRGVPVPVANGALRGLAAIAWWTRRGDRGLALRQLRLAFPDRSPAWHRWVARTALTRLAENLVSNVRGDEPVWTSPGGRRRLRSLRERGRPLLVVMAHYGPWELAGPALAGELPAFAALTANPHNARVDAWLRRERQQRGVEVFDRHRERHSAAKWLRRGGTLAVLVDYHSGSTQPVEWFGVPTPTVVGPARLARWAGADMVGVRVRGGPGHRELVVGPVLEEARGRDLDEILRWCNSVTEAWIREDPTHWTWWHDRFGVAGEQNEQ